MTSLKVILFEISSTKLHLPLKDFFLNDQNTVLVSEDHNKMSCQMACCRRLSAILQHKLTIVRYE